MGMPSLPRELFTLHTGKVETQSTPSALSIRAIPVPTSMDIVLTSGYFGWLPSIFLIGGSFFDWQSNRK
jgi:hypothetical protein